MEHNGKRSRLPTRPSARATDITALFPRCDRQLLRFGRRSKFFSFFFYLHVPDHMHVSSPLPDFPSLLFPLGRKEALVGGWWRETGTNFHLIFVRAN